MEDSLKLLSLLPCEMGEPFVNKVVSMNFDSKDAMKILSDLIEKNYAEIEGKMFVLTENGKNFLLQSNDERRESLSNINMKEVTKNVLKDIVIDSKKRRIHPSMFFDDTLAYTITYLITKEKIVEDKIEKTVEIEIPFIVTSEKDLIRCDKPPEDIILLDQPILPKGNGFLIRESTISKFPSQKAVLNFINGKANASFEEIFKEVRNKFEFFMDYDDPRYYSLCAVWSIGTYFHQLFSGYPYLFLNAVKGGGKSKNISCLAYCSFCPEIVVEPSVASMFRTIQSERCSFFLDEAEKLPNKKESSEIRTLLLSGYKKGAGISRTKETENKKLKSFESTTFDIYSPKAMGNIRGIEDIMESRCITIVLKKTMDSIKSGRNLPNKKYDSMFQPIRDNLFYNQMTNWKQVKKDYELLGELLEKGESFDTFDEKDIENIKVNLIGRNWELWHPLLTIALCVSKETFKEILSLAVDLTQERIGDELAEGYEPTAIRVLCQKIERSDWYSTTILAKELSEFEGLEHITGKSLTNIMKRVGLKAKNMPNRKIGGKHYAFINVDTLKDVARRMEMDYDEIRSENIGFAPAPKKEKLLNILKELNEKYKEGIPKYDIIFSARLFYTEDKLKEMLEKMQTDGILYCPRPNIYSLVKSEKQAKLDEIPNENSAFNEEIEDSEEAPESEE